MNINSFEDYKEFVSGRFKSEGPAHPPLLRVGLELAEEYLEYQIDPIKEELGDICFWFGYLSYIFDYDGDISTPAIIDKNLGETVKDICGAIKRYYRDNNESKLDIIVENLYYLQANITIFCEYNFNMTLIELMNENSKKLVKRNG